VVHKPTAQAAGEDLTERRASANSAAETHAKLTITGGGETALLNQHAAYIL
jgi:hypothetical protein